MNPHSLFDAKGNPIGDLHVVPVGESNLCYLVVDRDGRAFGVDATASAPILERLNALGARLQVLLLTHGHRDHTAGAGELREATQCRVLAPAELSLPGTTDPFRAGDDLDILGWRLRVLDTSGHSDCDRCFDWPEASLCFCGDTLFAGGCGRMFAGPPGRFWASLRRLRALPDPTLLCPGHDYRADNYAFAARTFPGIGVFAEILRRFQAGATPLLTHVGEETRSNPFFMADHAEIADALNLPGAEPAGVFARLREMRNGF